MRLEYETEHPAEGLSTRLEPDAGAQLDAALETDRAERDALQAKWERRLRMTHGIGERLLSEDCAAIVISIAVVLAVVIALLRLVPGMSTLSVDPMPWFMGYLGLVLAIAFILPRIESTIVWLAQRDGVEIQPIPWKRPRH